ncbi:Mediator complex subunit 3 fungal domain-containing protein [Pleurostoma richardsiae]|uniref:Mediator complex subunit 3 fungal domain-containing protein n=1 Tax=Pleurostoma richardsiae TaxID=41990 RepID=A0AA38R0Y7_9PEZI|nr:Mediator complex subunit 3 fungal domain-containing protein [Pleurostoma richardsiae]
MSKRVVGGGPSTNDSHRDATSATTTSPRGADDTVGSLLADVANALSDSLRILMFADKREWGPDEFEQIRALEDALDDAKKDFQELGPLVGGQFYYENDRIAQSLEELRALRTKFSSHAQNFKDWLRTGGPINPIWARETGELKRELHRAQCRAARRIFAAEQEANARCLGAFEVYRRQRELEARRGKRRSRPDSRYGHAARHELPLWNGSGSDDAAAAARQQQQRRQQDAKQPQQYGEEELTAPAQRRRPSLEELVPACNAVGKFERFGDRDIAFSCDFCDGFIVWEDVREMPSRRAPPPPGITEHPNWQAAARSVSGELEDKTVVFAPVAIANHVAPAPGRWQAGILCPYCDEYTYYAQGDDELEQVRYAQDEEGFPDLKSFQQHLEWYHTAVPVPSIPLLPKAARASCSVM